jgi:hypothetical protein
LSTLGYRGLAWRPQAARLPDLRLLDGAPPKVPVCHHSSSFKPSDDDEAGTDGGPLVPVQDQTDHRDAPYGRNLSRVAESAIQARPSSLDQSSTSCESVTTQSMANLLEG